MTENRGAIPEKSGLDLTKIETLKLPDLPEGSFPVAECEPENVAAGHCAAAEAAQGASKRR